MAPLWGAGGDAHVTSGESPALWLQDKFKDDPTGGQEDAIKGESYEMTTMYPGFIATAKAENAMGAVKSFRWAMDTEKKHHIIYQEALTALNGNKTNTLSGVYWVCPKCGNTYSVAKPEASCSFCSSKREQFLKFGK